MPLFVQMGKASCLRWTGMIYYRDGGDWSVGIRIEGGKLYTISDMDHMNGIELVEVTKEEWRESNGEYAPTDI